MIWDIIFLLIKIIVFVATVPIVFMGLAMSYDAPEVIRKNIWSMKAKIMWVSIQTFCRIYIIGGILWIIIDSFLLAKQIIQI